MSSMTSIHVHIQTTIFQNILLICPCPSDDDKPNNYALNAKLSIILNMQNQHVFPKYPTNQLIHAMNYMKFELPMFKNPNIIKYLICIYE